MLASYHVGGQVIVAASCEIQTSRETKMTSRYFYDIPVYRVPEERYYRECNEYIEGVIYPKGSPHNEAMRSKEAADPNCNISIRDHLQGSYGGCWQFNEIIGYIRLHFLGSQVRGEYFAVKRRRVVRTRTKTIEYLTWNLAPEVDIHYPPSNRGIYTSILEYLSACKKELPNRYVDTQLFEIIGPHVDWCDLLEYR